MNTPLDRDVIFLAEAAKKAAAQRHWVYGEQHWAEIEANIALPKAAA
jgi:hypothetical protein